jgi:hypothetical protein
MDDAQRRNEIFNVFTDFVPVLENFMDTMNELGSCQVKPLKPSG